MSALDRCLTALLDMGLAFVILAAIFVPLERAFRARDQRHLRPELGLDLLYFAAQYLVMSAIVLAFNAWLEVVFRGLGEVGPRRVVAELPLAVQLAIAIISGDVLLYWAHRASHAVPILWRFHAVHHSVRSLDWLAAHREHPLDGLYSQLWLNLPALLLGVDVSIVASFFVLRGFWAVFVHSNVRLPLGPLGLVLGDPVLHRWHHARRAQCTHNFANLAPYLDLVFGTHHRPADEAFELGIEEPMPRDLIGQLAAPLRRHVSVPALLILAAFSIASLPACAPESTLLVTASDLPNDTAYVALVVEGGASSGLIRAGAGAPVRFSLNLASAPDRARVTLLAYGEDALARFSPPDDTVLRDTPVRAAGAGDPRLPDPSFVAAGVIEDGAAVLAVAPRGEPWTAAWLGRCEQLEGALIDLSCSPIRCAGPVVQRGCRFEIDLTACPSNLGVLRGDLTPEGAVLSASPVLGRCATISDRERGPLSIGCESDDLGPCRIDVTEPDPRQRFDVARIEVAPRVAGAVNMRTGPVSITGITSIDKVLVAIHDPPVTLPCRGRAPTLLREIDIDRRIPIRTTTAPPCLANLRGLRGGSRFVATFRGPDGEPMLGRFGVDGTLLESTRLDVSPIAPDAIVIGLDLPEGLAGRAPVALAMASDAAGIGWSALYDTAPLERVAVMEVPPAESPRRFTSMTLLPGSAMALLDDALDEVVLVDPVARAHERRAIRVTVRSAPTFTRLAYQPHVGRLLAVAPDFGAVFVFDAGAPESQSAAAYFEADAAPVLVHRYFADDRLALIGLTENGGEGRALVALFDSGAPRFLRSAQPIGHGLIGPASDDGHRGYLVTLPTAGEVVRLTHLEIAGGR